ncbi:SOS response-associated peptidase family protein [Enorma phocaeensis]|uniref:SOS response-associated peptidase n=1 Tax=Enorma phocaeensis TaxID=1871019 RepID=A0A921LT54_9ACTN|nr:SOS response-associated peptidase family protein [Enorma phocaeensis]HJG37743.1 SOS response-associated peptidase [Enorma phocaeensis]
MCVRFSPLAAEEAQAVLDARGTARHGIRFVEYPDPIHDARPGSTVPLFVPDGAGGIKVAKLEWGFPLGGRPNAVFNTRIESALEQLRRGMWAKAIAGGRCLVPARAFYEGHATERVPSERTGKTVHRQYRFRLPGARAFLLVAVQQDGFFSIVTAEPNASVAPSTTACRSSSVRESHASGSIRISVFLQTGEGSIWSSIRRGNEKRSPNFGAREDNMVYRRSELSLLSIFHHLAKSFYVHQPILLGLRVR